MIILSLFALFGTFLETCSGNWSPYGTPNHQPCPLLDLNCTRAFFAQHSSCIPVDSPTLDYYPIEGLVLPFPHTNVTWLWNDAYATGLSNGQIRTFYINRNSKKLVFEVVFQKVTTRTSAGTIRYYYKGREPLELTDHFRITYRDMSQTLTVPFDSIFGIRWPEREVYTYIGDSYLPLIFGPGLCNEEPELLNSFQLTVGQAAQTVRGVCLGISHHYFNQYFNNNICKF